MYQKTTQMKIAGVFLIDFGSAQLGDCNLKIVYKMALKWHERDMLFLPVTKPIAIY